MNKQQSVEQLVLDGVQGTSGDELERQSKRLFETYRYCKKCGMERGVRPVLTRENELIWGCERCFPPEKPPREDKKLIAALMLPMFPG